MRILGNYAVVLLLAGQGSFVTARTPKAKLRPGDLLFVFPEIPHWYGPPEGSLWDEFYIVFSGPLFDLWRTRGLLDPSRPVLHVEPLDYWLRRLEEVVIGEADPLQQVCSLQHLLAEAIEASDSRREPQWLAKAYSLLQAENMTAQRVASELGMTYETFRKRFAEMNGLSPRRYQLTELIDKACAMLVAEDITNKEIAERLDFGDEFHFSRQFKHILGLTTTQFRQRLPRKK